MRYLVSESSAAILRALGAARGGVSFADRRIAPPSSISGGHQWRISASAETTPAEGEGEEPTVRVLVSVGPGIVAWGAGINYANPGAEGLGPLAPGESARVVWATGAAPLPLVHDPRWPTGDAPPCSDPDCDCPSREGDPAGRGGDAGALLLVDDDWTAPEGTTDVREIGAVAVSSSGAVTISQLQRDTIVARAIVGRAAGDEGGGGGEDPATRDPPCGNPLNAEPDYNPLDHVDDRHEGEDPEQGGGGGSGNPLDDAGEGGYTPTCSDLSSSAA